MKIAKVYSHNSGVEWIEKHRRKLWREIRSVIRGIDAAKHRTKISKEKTMRGKRLLAPKALNAAFHDALTDLNWEDKRVNFATCDDDKLLRKIVHLPFEDQLAAIHARGKVPIKSYSQTDFVKDSVHVEVQFGKYSFFAHDLFVKHTTFWVSGVIDVGIEILPMKSMQAEMSSGPGYYELALHQMVSQSRGTPPVQLILVGVTP